MKALSQSQTTCHLHTAGKCVQDFPSSQEGHCFGTTSQKRKCPLKSGRTTLELNLVSAEMVLNSSNRADLDEKQLWPRVRVLTDLRCVEET